MHKATAALISHLRSTPSTSLLSSDASIFVSLTLKKIPGHASNKPVRLAVPHPMLDGASQLCVIVADPAEPFKDKLAAAPVPGITKVIGVKTLKREYGQYKDRRELAARCDAFLCDDRCIRMMPQLLGKVFYESKKHPYPVKLTTSGWAHHLETARDATYLHLGWGSVTSIKVGRSSWDPKAVAENVIAALAGAGAALPGKWRNVQAVHLGATDSLSLPLWKTLPNLRLGADLPAGGEAPAGRTQEDEEMEALEDLLRAGLPKSTAKSAPKPKKVVLQAKWRLPPVPTARIAEAAAATGGGRRRRRRPRRRWRRPRRPSPPNRQRR